MTTVSYQWCFFKIYAEPSYQNRILLHYIYPVIKELTTKGAIKQWFFVRYSDLNEIYERRLYSDLPSNNPGYHLRIRILLSSSWEIAKKIIESSMKNACQTGICQDWQYASYVPETQRYGGYRGIELAHQIFHLNSQNIIDLLSISLSKTFSWAILRTGDELLNCLGLNIESRIQLYCCRFQWFASEYHFDTIDYTNLENFYHKRYNEYTTLFCNSNSRPRQKYLFLSSPDLLQEIGDQFLQYEKDGQLSTPKQDIFAALHHMHFNRSGLSSLSELSMMYFMHRILKDGYGFSYD